MKTITVKLPEPLAAWLLRHAKELGRPQSQIVRDALERARVGKDAASCHDLMADVCGIISGPKDLSTNPKHLIGFGE
jgi:Ribbon-helix-helix protein, copG family